MQTNAREKIKKRAETLMSKSTCESVTQVLSEIATSGHVRMICGGDSDTECKYATAGLSLNDCPELFIIWPCPSMREAAIMILNDLIVECHNGNSKQKLVVGRNVYAQAYGIGYRIDIAPDVDGSPLYEFLRDNRTPNLKKSDVPFAMQLEFVTDVRDDVILSFGIKGGLALWRKKDGVKTFTGLVRCPIPSPNWAAAGRDYCLVEMLDPDTDDLESACRVVTPAEAMEIFSEFD